LERRFAKLHLYEILSGKYGEKMPWGALTGIRPTKLAYTELEQGNDFKELFRKMHVCEDNISLVEKILQTQTGIYEKRDGNTDFFVSLPFCPTKCAYCSFITAPIEKTRSFLPEYLRCLNKELLAAQESVGRLRSVYVGGGTPFALNEGELFEVLKGIEPIFRMGESGTEYTVEAGRPDAITESNLALLKKYNVTRICINPQTFSDKTLELLGRKHTAQDVIDKFNLAKGMFDINMDLIAGLEGETLDDFKMSLDKAVSLSPENITVHTLCIKLGELFSHILDSGADFRFGFFPFIGSEFIQFYCFIAVVRRCIF
jgi:oxygen-independent coproporphyrinogen-3 oxidase